MNVLTIVKEQAPDGQPVANKDLLLFAYTTIEKELYHDKVNCYTTLNDMPAEDKDFVRCHIYADWQLSERVPHSFTVAKRILLNSIINN